MFIKQWHPAAEAFPLMQGEKFQEFADDIRAHGVLKPIEFYDGNRWPEFKGLGIDGASPKLLGFIRDDRLTIRDAMFAIKQRKDHEQTFAALEEGRIDFQRFRDWCYLEKEHPDLWSEFRQNRMECEDALVYAKERDAALRKAESRPVEAESADALKKRVEYAYKKLSDTTSIYRIASTLGISYEVASKIINAMPPEDEELEAASAVQPPPCEQAPDREQAPSKSIATDRLNRPLDAKMVPVFSELAEFDDLIASLGHFKSRIEKLVRQPSGALLNLRVLGDSLKNIEDHLKKKSPLCVCPSCSGAGRQDQQAKTCPTCDGQWRPDCCTTPSG